MQLTKGAIGNLINRYKAVLKKCHLMNTFGSLAVAGMLIMGGAGVAGAAITTGQDFRDAVSSAKPGDTITLGQDIKEGVGAVFTGKTVTVDFGRHTYTGYSDSVGSPGTETQLFQLLKESSAVTLKNGILNIATPTAESGKFKMVLQNYCDLTLDNMVVDGTNLLGDGTYTMSNNHGDITINNSTIIAKKDGVAFDVYYWPKGGYGDGVSVTVNNSTINGKIEVTVDGSAALKDGAKHQLTLTGGTLTGGLTAAQGAQLYNEGTTVISNVAMARNTATDKGGAIFNSDDKTGAMGDLTLNNVDLKGNNANFGGAIWNEGTLTVNGGSFEGNTAATAAGAIYNAAGATLTVDGVTFANNSSNNVAGAINNRDGTVIITNSTFKGNSVPTSAGGAIYNASGNLSTLGTITITGSTFEGNTAGNGGAVWNGSDGKVDIADSTFKGNTALAGIGQGGAITNADQMTITGGSFANNTANYSGGAIYNGAHAANGQASLTIDGTTFTGNSVKADFNTTQNDNIAGGAIFNDTNAKLDVKNATFTDNTSSLKGGAIFNRDGTVTITNSTFKGNSVPKSAGGAVLNESGNTEILGTITIKGSTFEGNTAGNGGAVWNGSNGQVDIADSTFKGNTALAGIGQGGAITNADQMTITGSTFEGNQAGKIGGAIFNAASGKLNFNGTNTFTNNTAAGKANDIYNAGTITVAGGTTTLNSGLILAAGSTTSVSGGALVINGTTTWEKGDTFGSLTVKGGALTLQKGDVLEGYDKAKGDTSLSVASGALYLINKDDYTAKNFTDAKDVLLKNANASFGFVGGQLVDDGGNVTGLVVSGNEIKGDTTFATDGLESTKVDNSSFLENDLTVKADPNTDVTIDSADVAVNKVNIETTATGDKSLTINNNGSLTVVGGNANDKLIAANGDDLKKIDVKAGELNLGSAAMPERGAGTLGSAEIALDSNGSLNASNGDYTVGDVTGTGKVTADAANIKATGDVTAGGITLAKGGSVTSDKNITVNGSIEDADGTLQAGGNITVQNDITKAGNGKLTVVAGDTITAANISATNVAAKKLTASGVVAVDGGVLKLTGTGTATADASTVDSLKLTNGTQNIITRTIALIELNGTFLNKLLDSLMKRFLFHYVLCPNVNKKFRSKLGQFLKFDFLFS